MKDILQVMLGHAEALQRQGRLPEAIEAYQDIVRRWPTLAQCWFNLGVLQRQSRQLQAALNCYANALNLGIPRAEEVYVNRAVIFSDYLRDHASAERELRLALLRNAKYVPALLNLANLCEDLGRRDEARALYERILERNGTQFEALARYANLHPASSPSEKMVGRLQSALADPRASAAERASLGFALGRLLDGAGAYGAAFEAYAAANGASRASVEPPVGRYDRAQQEATVSRLIGTSMALTRGRAPLPERALCELPQPIFICGMFRSGSTLVEQLIAAHPSVAAAGELDFLPRLAAVELAPFPETLLSIPAGRLHHLAARYRADLAAASPTAVRITDKRPDNFLHLGLIKALFPDAKVIHTTRDPLDNCLSIFFLHLDQHLSYALDLMDTGHYYRQYRRLMGHWKEIYGGDILDFDYDEFVRSPKDNAQQLFEFLGLSWDDRYLDRPIRGQAVRTASVWQVREPLHTRSSGRARHYHDQLAGLRAYLSEPSPVPPAESSAP
jgi:tetratricopeptide (TPR) repeat protein